MDASAVKRSVFTMTRFFSPVRYEYTAKLSPRLTAIVAAEAERRGVTALDLVANEVERLIESWDEGGE